MKLRAKAYAALLLVLPISGCEAPEAPAEAPAIAEAPRDPCHRRMWQAPYRDLEPAGHDGHAGWNVERSTGAAYAIARWEDAPRVFAGDAATDPAALNTEMDFLVVPRATWQLSWPGVEPPVQDVAFQHGFAVSKDLVSVGAWRQCEAACFCQIRVDDNQSDDDPVLGVSWEDARSFYFWLHQVDPQAYPFRHPSAAEWLVVQQLASDFFDNGHFEWVGDCASIRDEEKLRDGRRARFIISPFGVCGLHQLIAHNSELSGTGWPFLVDRARRDRPRVGAGFRLARDFDIDPFEARGSSMNAE